MSDSLFKTKPMTHQLKALEMSEGQEYFAYLMEMGTGKSFVLINDVAREYRLGKIGALIYTAPKGAFTDFPDIQVPTHLPDDIPRIILKWGSKTFQEDFKKAVKVIDKLIIFAINVEAMAYDSGKEAVLKFIKEVPGQVMFSVDESTCIKNIKAQRTKNVVTLGKLCAKRRILSGSPVTRSPLDMYGQGIFLSPKFLGYSSFVAFRARYAIVKDQRLTGGRSFPMVVGYQNLDELKMRVQAHSFRVLKSQCLDLPDKIYQYREVEMTKEQMSAYRDMAKEGVAFLGDGGMVSAVGALALLTRLHQITCGHVKNDDGEEIELPHKRLDALMEVLEQTAGKVIIWATYVKNIKDIKKLIIKEYGEESVVDYYGATSDEDRAMAKNRFQNDPKTRFFIGNPSTGRYSLTLTEASTVVYYSNSYDLEHRIQSEDRAHRIGQKNNVTYIDLVIRKTMDEVIYKSLKSKINIAASITGDQLKQWLTL